MRTVLFGLVLFAVGVVGALIIEPALPESARVWVSDTREDLADQGENFIDDLAVESETPSDESADQNESFTDSLEEPGQATPDAQTANSIPIALSGSQDLCDLSPRELFSLEDNGKISGDQVAEVMISCNLPVPLHQISLDIAERFGASDIPANVFFLTGPPNEYVSRGIDRVGTRTNGSFLALGNVEIRFNGVDIGWWSLKFSAPSNRDLVVGVYENATKFGTGPGLNVWGDGRSCGTNSKGRFEILEVEFGPVGEVIKFAANFEQHCGEKLPALRGAIRYSN